MPETENYGNLVIGSGEAGKYLAWSLAKDNLSDQTEAYLLY
jgi:hypothetical protein